MIGPESRISVGSSAQLTAKQLGSVVGWGGGGRRKQREDAPKDASPSLPRGQSQTGGTARKRGGSRPRREDNHLVGSGGRHKSYR